MTGEAISSVRGVAASSPADLDYEADLVRRAKARSQEAWTELYERNYTKLFRYTQARVGERQTAEDLTASVFLEALKSIGSYRNRGKPLLAWLYTIARNVVNYHYRSSFRKRLPGRAADPEEVGGDDPGSEIDRWDLQDAVRHLTDDQREVIILRYFVGLTTPEVARLVGKHERAVYSLQTRAIQALRRRLA